MAGPLAYKDPKKGYTKRKKGFLRPGDDRDILAAKFELEKDSFMRVKELYKALHDELADDEWKDPISEDDKFEGLYWERILENGFKEHHVWWRLVYQPNRENTYFRWAAKIDFQTLLVRKEEIAYKGKKKKVEGADLILRMEFWLQIDTEDHFKDGGLIKNFHRMFKRHMFMDEIKMQRDQLADYAVKIQKWVKTYLDMEESGEQPLHFHPEGGYKDPYAPW